MKATHKAETEVANVHVQVTSPYLRSEYGKDYDYDSPVKLLDLLLHGKCKQADQQVVVLGHVLAADCTIGYEDLQNYQVTFMPANPFHPAALTPPLYSYRFASNTNALEGIDFVTEVASQFQVESGRPIDIPTKWYNCRLKQQFASFVGFLSHVNICLRGTCWFVSTSFSMQHDAFERRKHFSPRIFMANCLYIVCGLACRFSQ